METAKNVYKKYRTYDPYKICKEKEILLQWLRPAPTKGLYWKKNKQPKKTAKGNKEKPAAARQLKDAGKAL